MKSPDLPTALVQYAALHRDQRNIILHIFCIPLMLLAIAVLLSPLQWGSMGQVLTIGWIVLLVGTAYFYVRTAGKLGWVTSALMVTVCLAAQMLAQWLGIISGAVLLLAGYMSHRLGHWYEGNYAQLQFRFSLLGAAPLFATSQILQRAGIFQQIYATIENKVGPSYIRDMVNIQAD